MAEPQRIRLSRAKGWRLPAGAVNVARPGKRGNPFVVGRDGTRAECVSMFALLAAGFVDLGGRHSIEDQLALHRLLGRARRDLGGHDVACWCPLDGDPCHGDVWLHLANGGDREGLVRFYVDPPRPRILMLAADVARLVRKKAARDRAEGEAGG